MSKRVCVTGAAGYVGSHVVAALLRRGHHVRAAVRDPENRARNAHLFALPLADAAALELVRLDLEDSGTFEPAFEGMDAVIHTASAVQLTAKDPEREIVGVAVKGAENAMRAATRAGVPRLVMTSSVAAVVSEELASARVFTEADWNESATTLSDAYATSKVKAERAARRLARDAGAPTLVCILPSLILGPVLAEQHLRTSPAVLAELLKGGWPGVPDLRFDIVDVRDVADVHVRAMEHTAPAERYLATSEIAPLREMAKVLREAAPTAKVPTHNLPGFLMYAAALFDKRLTFSFLRQNLGRAPRFDAAKTRRDLEIEPRRMQEIVRDTARSIEEGRFLEK